jgi:hypothetical protein
MQNYLEIKTENLSQNNLLEYFFRVHYLFRNELPRNVSKKISFIGNHKGSESAQYRQQTFSHFLPCILNPKRMWYVLGIVVCRPRIMSQIETHLKRSVLSIYVT